MTLKLIRRLILLYLGLILYGVASAGLVRARLGLDPWNVFHRGIAHHVPLSLGTIIIIFGALALALWIPLKVKPGLGTVSNLFVIGFAIDIALAWMPPIISMPARIAVMVGAIITCGVATSMYIGTAFGTGPRDGLMTGLAARTGWSIKRVRTMIEVCVLSIGWLLGGEVGIGTVLFATCIGPLVHWTMPFFRRVAGSAPLN